MQILRCDEHLIIIDKPPAMLTHAHRLDRGAPTVVSLLGDRVGGPIYNVHRLDRMTTGAMVLARTPEAARELSRQFREREVSKSYLAIVRGHLDDAGTMETPIAHRTRDEEQGARTDYRTLGRGTIAEPVGGYAEAWFSLVMLDLHTGRSHQARRHLHRIDHPVIGDNKHGDKTWNRWAANRLGERHLYLRALELVIRHPESGVRLSVRLGVPPLWLRFLELIGVTVPDSLRRLAEICHEGEL